MEANRTELFGTLKFSFKYELTDAEDRPHPWNCDGKGYRPDELYFTLISEALDASRLPRYKDLRVYSVSIHGHRLKNDGTPGRQEVNESFYLHGEHPACD